jgi:hypothetical protein
MGGDFAWHDDDVWLPVFKARAKERMGFPARLQEMLQGFRLRLSLDGYQGCECGRVLGCNTGLLHEPLFVNGLKSPFSPAKKARLIAEPRFGFESIETD